MKKQDEKQAFLEMLTYRGELERYGTDEDPVVRKRIEHELDVIERAGFAEYFCIVWDIMRFCREKEIPVGPGRGSVCGSVVAYCTRIIDVDPIRWDIPFERFLNLDRIAQPDIDLDICADRRDEVIDYLRGKYNTSDDPMLTSVAQIATFGTLMAKGVVRDVCRILNVDQLLYGVHANETGEKLSKLIPEGSGADQIELEEWVREGSDEAKVFWQEMEKADTLYQEKYGISIWECCTRMEGIRRHTSSHAAGVVIADRPLIEVVPLAKKNKGADIQIQYDMRDAEEIGLLKMDVLGLRTVTLIGEAERLAGVRMLDVPLDDDQTYQLLRNGDTMGVFQLEGEGITNQMKGIHPDEFEDIIALLALYRPGPMEQIPSYARRKLDREDVEYAFPELEQVLSKTYGLMVYQEQVMAIARLLAGYSAGEADYFRKAIGKKDLQLIAEQIGEFVRRAKENGWDSDKVEDLATQISKFGRYGFNRGHATGYAFITYWTAYLKAHHPAAFYTATLNSFIGDTGRLGEFILDARKHGVEVRVPDINKSRTGFTLSDDGHILFGLEAVKGIGENAAVDIIEERDELEKTEYGRKTVEREKVDEEGNVVKRYKASILDKSRVPNEPRLFDGYYDFCQRLTHIPITAKRALIEAGAFGEEWAERALLLQHAKDINDTAKKGKKYAMPDLEGSVDVMDLLRKEKDVLGFYVTGHPLDEYRGSLERYGAIFDGDYQRLRKNVTVAGIIMTIKTHQSKRGEMAWLTLENGIDGFPRVTAFNDAWGPARAEVSVGTVVVVTGKKDTHPTFGDSIIVNTILPVKRNAPNADRVMISLFESDIGHMAEVAAGCDGRGAAVDLIVEDRGRFALIATEKRVRPTSSWLQTVEGQEGASGLARFDHPRKGPYDWNGGVLVRKDAPLAGAGEDRTGIWELPMVRAAVQIFGGKVIAELGVAE